MTNPFQIGVITLDGTPQKLGTLLSGSYGVRTLILKSRSADEIFIGESADVNSGTLVDVIDVIAAGERYVIGGFKNADDINWQNFYVLGTNGDKLIVSGQTVS